MLLESSSDSSVTISELDDQWFEHYCKFNNANAENSKTHKKILNNLIPEKFFTSLLVKNEVIACGMGVVENGFIGLFDIVVSERHRNNGYGTQLLINMLKVGKEQGAKNAYLQVMLDNKPALHLYNKLGFKEEYQYFYRVLPDRLAK